MDIVKTVAKMRLSYYSNMLSVVNIGNQLHILSNDKANKLNKKNLANCIDAMEHLGYKFTGENKVFHDFMEQELK